MTQKGGFLDLASQKSIPRFQIKVHPLVDRFGNRLAPSKGRLLDFVSKGRLLDCNAWPILRGVDLGIDLLLPDSALLKGGPAKAWSASTSTLATTWSQGWKGWSLPMSTKADIIVARNDAGCLSCATICDANVSQGRRRRRTKWCRIARAICSAFGILSPFLFGQEGALEEGEQFEPAQPDEKQISSFCPKPHVPDWGGQGET